MSTPLQAELTERIRAEWEKKRGVAPSGVFDALDAGDIVDATSIVLFRTEPEKRRSVIESIERTLPQQYEEASPERRRVLLRFCVKLALDLGSFIPAWRRGKPGMETELAERLLGLTDRLAAADSGVASDVYGELRHELRSRLDAEAVSDSSEADRIADGLMSRDLGAHIRTMWGDYAASNMLRAAEMNLAGETVTTLGNDYAAFLDHAMRVGAGSQTTNPVLIKLAWDTDRTGWDARIDDIIRNDYDQQAIRRALAKTDADRDTLIRSINTAVTTTVVEGNCRILRDIFLMTDGREGYLNLQVSPDSYADADAMVTQAVAVYEDLERRLGGVPNVVIKVPATPAGKEAAARLTKRGIGVTVTLTFSMFQACPVAEAIRDSNALVSNIAIMNGRLAFPVRDELIEAGVPGGPEAARWAGVAVARKVYRRLYNGSESMGIDQNRVRLIIASLRIYDDWLPDIGELWGVPSITIFPNVRRALDAHPREIDGNAVANQTPADAVDTMLKSELFRQAWWTPDDGKHGQPNRPLSMDVEDAEAVADWAPVKQTLDQFIDGYHTMNTMILNRLQKLGEEESGENDQNRRS